MKTDLQDLLELPTTPVVPTVREKYWENTIVIIYTDGSVARIDIGAGDFGEEITKFKCLYDFACDMYTSYRSITREVFEQNNRSFLKDHFSRDDRLAEIFKRKDNSVWQVWAASF